MATHTPTMTNGSAKLSIDNEADLIDYAEKVQTKPLWTQMAKLNPPLPNPKCVPYIWRYDEIRPSLLRAGELVPEEKAERRVLMLINPARGIASLLRNVTCAYSKMQMRHLLLIRCTRACSLSCPTR